MPSPRFKHGYKHDVFISYTHTDDRLDGELRWVTKFMNDLRARLEIASGHAVDIWRDEEKLNAADRFNLTIAEAVAESALMLVILSPSYFNSSYCRLEREEFYRQIEHQSRCNLGEDKSRILKVAKFYVELENYPPDLRELLEHKFYVQLPGKTTYREFHVSEDPKVRDLYMPRVADVAQEIAGLLAALEAAEAPAEPKGIVYLAQSTSDVESERDQLRRELVTEGYEVQPKTELRLLSASHIQKLVTETISKCRLTIHPVGEYYGFVPEGAGGKSVVDMQIEAALASVHDGQMGHIIWVRHGLEPKEEAQNKFLEKLRREVAGHGVEFLQSSLQGLVTHIRERLRNPLPQARAAVAASGIYLVCDNSDRPLAKILRSFLFNEGHDIEWTPISLDYLTQYGEHTKRLRRNRTHLVLHGKTSEAWIQDRIRELNELRTAEREPQLQGIYLADPRREDKNEILVRDIVLLDGYLSNPVSRRIKTVFS